jgi:hypothetical protein
MNGTTLALAAAIALVVGGLAALLTAEAMGLGTAIIAVFGAVVVGGVGVLTAVVARAPEPEGGEQHGV